MQTSNTKASVTETAQCMRNDGYLVARPRKLQSFSAETWNCRTEGTETKAQKALRPKVAGKSRVFYQTSLWTNKKAKLYSNLCFKTFYLEIFPVYIVIVSSVDTNSQLAIFICPILHSKSSTFLPHSSSWTQKHTFPGSVLLDADWKKKQQQCCLNMQQTLSARYAQTMINTPDMTVIHLGSQCNWYCMGIYGHTA